MKPWISLSLHYGRRHSKPFAGILVLMFIDIGFNVLAPWPLKLIVDNVLADKPLPDAVEWINLLPGATATGTLLVWLALSTLLLFIGRRLLQLIIAYLNTGASTRIKLDLAGDVFTHLQKLSPRFYGSHKVGDLLRRVQNDTEFIKSLITNVAFPAIIAVATLFIMFMIMWELNPELSVIALIVALPMPVLIRYLTPRISQLSYEQSQAEGELMAVAEQTISSLPIIQAFGRESDEDRRFRGSSKQAINKYLQMTNTQLQYALAVGTITAIGTAGLMVVGGLQVLSEQLSIGSLLVCLAYLVAMYQPLEALAYLPSSYADCEGKARRVMHVMEAEQDVHDQPGAPPLTKPADHQGIAVTFENVTFGYESGFPILDDINLTVQAGETIALVGTTGAGKSTLASLIPRFFDPDKGRILFNGSDARDVQLQSLRQQVAMVLQEPFLLPLTIAENIAYGQSNSSHEQIIAAAVAANADEFIQRLPQGYDTVIGERGMTLSGGQRQRLSIARALLKDAPILILDEPTSALDNKTETLILGALERLMSNRTTFIIAHRLSTIRDADRIIVLKEGKIVEQGTHEELMSAKKEYWQYHMLR
ncbi:MAG: ABC transporter ATP-binding protein [Gammaproteobacteria bacterium]|nr:MAG: ABC transporter ATP-binding protein [Gammaproteobacteria bacterium]